MPIKLVVSDVDGTMVAGEKQLTPATIAAARPLQEAGTASTHRSQPYDPDVTTPAADRGTAVRAFARWFGVNVSDVCVPPNAA